MCVVLVYFLTLRMSIFEKIMLDDILLTKHHVIKAERAQTKSRNDAIGYRRKLPLVKITLPQDKCQTTHDRFWNWTHWTCCVKNHTFKQIQMLKFICNESCCYCHLFVQLLWHVFHSPAQVVIIPCIRLKDILYWNDCCWTCLYF